MFPWGHKLTVSIYVERVDDFDELPAVESAQAAANALRNYGWTVDYVGAKVETVDEKPQNQGAR